MGKIYTFLLGGFTGFGLCYFAMGHHVVHAEDGLHLVPKVETSLSQAYVDIRGFGPGDWQQYPKLGAAIAASDDAELKQMVLGNTVEQGVNRILDFLPNAQPNR